MTIIHVTRGSTSRAISSSSLGDEENLYGAAGGVDVSRARPAGLLGILGAMDDKEIQPSVGEV